LTKRVRLAAAALVVVAVGAWFVTARGSDGRDERRRVGLTEFGRELDRGNVATAELFDGDNRLEGELRDGTGYVVRFPEQYTDEITARVVGARIDLKVQSQHASPWTNLLWNVLPLVIVLVIILVIVRSMTRVYGRNVLGFGRSRARSGEKDEPQVTFADVAGLDEAVEELREIKDFLTEPRRFEAMGAKIPKGVLLYGPPGTGKTLLARACAGEAGVPFFSMSGSDFVEMFVGVGAARVRDLFKEAKASAPAIVFVDEIDAVGRQRGAGVGGGHDEREQTLNQLLVEMDGFDVRTGVIIIAATNRPDILDPALLRPGRFDRQVVVDRPDLAGRRAILAVHARGKPLADGVDLDVIARRTPGFTGADLANLVNEAALLAARRGFDRIGTPQLEDAIERVLAGPERRTRVMSEHEQRVIAYHESGHALVGHALPSRGPVHKISIIPRGRALGYTLVLPTEDRLLTTRSELISELAMLLGGRTAEELTFADPSTGAFDDIERATTIARRMVTEFGMSEELGTVRLGTARAEPFLGRDVGHGAGYSQEVAAQVDAEVRRLLDDAHETARRILVANRAVLDALAAALLERETLDATEVEVIVRDVPQEDFARGLRAASSVAATEPPPEGAPQP
jgi:cell division protease FtsH